MSDFGWCCITIGGQLPASKANGLAQAIKDDAPQCCDIINDKLKGKEYLDQFMKKDGEKQVLEVEDDDAYNGEMNETEAFCANNGLIYLRVSGECGGYDPENMFWDGSKAHHSIANKENESTLTMYSIVQTMKFIEALFLDGNPKKEAALLVNSEIEKEICIRDYILTYGNPTKWGALRAYLDMRDPRSNEIPEFKIL